MCNNFIIFFPSVLLGLISPIILKLKLEDLENAGKKSGKIKKWML